MSDPTIGRIVIYRSRTGNYDLPAIVNCTKASAYQGGIDAGFLPPLSSKDHVHLTVFSPGRPGQRVTGAELKDVEGQFLTKSAYPVSENVSGCYQEWDIPYDADGGPGTWSWPTRA